jgi:hypothetical protein
MYMDWELLAKSAVGLCLVLIGYVYIQDQNNMRAQIKTLSEEVRNIQMSQAKDARRR